MASLIYTGPNNKKLGLHQYQIFAGALPQFVKDDIAKNPGLENSFVDFAKFALRRPPGAPVRKAVVAASKPKGTPFKKHQNLSTHIVSNKK